ncbi:hypothetical protein DMENIID0001_005230 [Sergentomyia squamirostris]
MYIVLHKTRCSDQPLDLSLTSSLRSSAEHPISPFQRLQNLRPVAYKDLFRGKSKRKSRAMTSTILTSSPKMKRREELEEKKRLMIETKEAKKKIREEKRKIREQMKIEAQKNKASKNKKLVPDPDTEKKVQKKRGRPLKIKEVM